MPWRLLGAVAVTVLALASYFGLLPWVVALPVSGFVAVAWWFRFFWRSHTSRTVMDELVAARRERFGAARRRPAHREAPENDASPEA